MARVALTSRPAGCVVVLGARASRLRRELAGLPVETVINLHWRRGLATSLAAGLSALPANARAALLLLADQASIGPAELELLIAAWRRQPRAIVAASAAGVLGPPAILPRRLFREARRLQGDSGARELLRDPARGVIAFELPQAAGDIDRPADAAGLSRARASARTPRSARSSRGRRPRSSGAT
jgi:CTP:molybdopterin cytidylyltransferase MocA